MCVKVAEQTDFFHVIELGRPKGTERRIFYEYFVDHCANAVVRSVLTALISYPASVVKCKLLRVLDKGENGDNDKSMAEVCGNVNLRYLAQETPSCSVCTMEPPSSACFLWNLQTLIVTDKYSYLIVLAPPEIWKMRQLRHVKCNKVYLPDPPNPRNRQDCMENLQTLSGVLNLRLSDEVCQIIPNIKKLSLIFHPELHGHDSGLVECLRNLDGFHKLESLNMKFKPELDWDLRSKLAFPLSLKKLHLSSLRLRWEDLLMIGLLPQLQVLILKCMSSIQGRDRWSPISGQFRHLKYLKIENCDLRSWDADSSHFPVLEKLVFRKLFCLKGIPLEIGEISTLELIRVKCCKESIAISALKIKKDQLENYDNDTLQIEVVVDDEEDAESFKKSMEAKELAFDLLNKLEIYYRG